MSLIKFEAPLGRAERQFRDAFERLKRGKPEQLPKGTKVTQNNVAREAGVDPSALRKSRFPGLVAEIQQWLDANDQGETSSTQQTAGAVRRRNRDLREKKESMQAQRDDALAKLVDAEARIIELTIENERLHALLPASKITPLRPPHKK